MESHAFFEKKVNLRPEDLNAIDETTTVATLLEGKIKAKLENKCSEYGFVIPGTVKLISHSVGYFEAARFTGDAVYYVKAEGSVLYPADGLEVDGKVIRKNKMGLYLDVQKGIRVQVPRDLNFKESLRQQFETIDIGDEVRVILKKSLFQINDDYILTNGIFVGKVGSIPVNDEEGEEEEEEGNEEGEGEGQEEGNEEGEGEGEGQEEGNEEGEGEGEGQEEGGVETHEATEPSAYTKDRQQKVDALRAEGKTDEEIEAILAAGQGFFASTNE